MDQPELEKEAAKRRESDDLSSLSSSISGEQVKGEDEEGEEAPAEEAVQEEVAGPEPPLIEACTEKEEKEEKWESKDTLVGSDEVPGAPKRDTHEIEILVGISILNSSQF